MTTTTTVRKHCAVCGAESDHTVIGGVNQFGAGDLDSRPAEPQRSAITSWVQRCPTCGYCAHDLNEAQPGAQAVVESEPYRNQLSDSTAPALANAFLCKGIIDGEAGNYAAATWALVHAAWVCDDAHLDRRARRCRADAAEMARRAEAHEQLLTNLHDADTAILVDLLRRSGQPDKALIVIAERRGGITNSTIAKMLDYEVALIARGDTGCHTIEDATEHGQ